MALSIKTKSTTFQCEISPWATSFETDCTFDSPSTKSFIELAPNLHIFQIVFSLQPLIYLENGAIFIQAPSAVKK